MGPTGIVKFSYSEYSPETDIVRSIVCVAKSNIKTHKTTRSSDVLSLRGTQFGICLSL